MSAQSTETANLMEFSATDADNDQSTPQHCAALYYTGWWYNSCDTSSVLNQFANSAWSTANAVADVTFSYMWLKLY